MNQRCSENGQPLSQSFCISPSTTVGLLASCCSVIGMFWDSSAPLWLFSQNVTANVNLCTTLAQHCHPTFTVRVFVCVSVCLHVCSLTLLCGWSLMRRYISVCTYVCCAGMYSVVCWVCMYVCIILWVWLCISIVWYCVHVYVFVRYSMWQYNVNVPFHKQETHRCVGNGCRTEQFEVLWNN